MANEALIDCWECDLSQGKIKPGYGDIVIKLKGGWMLNHYGGGDTFLGRLILQPNEHRECLNQLLPKEARYLGEHIKNIDKHLRAYWEGRFPTDLIQRMYVCHFSEGTADRPHLHFHLIPRTQKMGELLKADNDNCIRAWDIYTLNRHKELPTAYLLGHAQSNEIARQLMSYLLCQSS